MQISSSELSKRSSVRKSAVSDFLHNRYSKAGKNNCKSIREACYQLGILSRPKSRKPSACRNCGLQYPTRKPKAVHATVDDQGRRDFLPPSSGQNNNSDEPSQSESVKNPFTPAA
jgi:hypothetical protein